MSLLRHTHLLRMDYLNEKLGQQWMMYAPCYVTWALAIPIGLRQHHTPLNSQPHTILMPSRPDSFRIILRKKTECCSPVGFWGKMLGKDSCCLQGF